MTPETVWFRAPVNDAAVLRPVIEARRQDAELHPDPAAPVDVDGWQEYLELLDEPNENGDVELPIPVDLLRSVLYDGVRDALADAADVVGLVGSIGEAKQLTERAAWFTRQLSEVGVDRGEWADRLADVMARVQDIAAAVTRLEADVRAGRHRMEEGH